MEACIARIFSIRTERIHELRVPSDRKAHEGDADIVAAIE
jgi:hypothetical protein